MAPRLLAAVLVGLVGGLPIDASADGSLVASGRDLFARSWQTPPAGRIARDGLGPLFNARSCAECHPSGGRPPLLTDDRGIVTGPGYVVRLAQSQGLSWGRQLQTLARAGLPAEGRVRLTQVSRTERLASGASVELVMPQAAIEPLTDRPAPPPDQLSGRLAPALRGLDLIAAIPEAELTSSAASSGGRRGGVAGTGRFGLKATHATLESQVADAASVDLGLASPAVPAPSGDCTVVQPTCRALEPPDLRPALDARALAALTTFTASLQPPPVFATGSEPGRRVFVELGCSDCHRPTYRVAVDARRYGTGHVTIAPYSDFLLHDLGPELGDSVGEATAHGTEWRTAPLWGISAAMRSGGRFLHDGRARTPLEAILWHGGTATPSAAAVAALAQAELRELLEFLGTL